MLDIIDMWEITITQSLPCPSTFGTKIFYALLTGVLYEVVAGTRGPRNQQIRHPIARAAFAAVQNHALFVRAPSIKMSFSPSFLAVYFQRG
jgi:hypothetical protein